MVDDATGVVGAANTAVAALQALQTDEQKLRGTSDLNAHANSLGLTGVINAGNLPDQEFALQLWRQGSLTIRMRPLFPADSAEQVETRLANNFSQGGRSVGDDLFRVAGFGERIGGNDTMSSTFEPAARVIARHRWLLQQHSISLQENDFHLKVFQSIARDHPIADLRWALIHLQSIDEPRLKTLSAWALAPARRRGRISAAAAVRHSGASSIRGFTPVWVRTRQTSPPSTPGCRSST